MLIAIANNDAGEVSELKEFLSAEHETLVVADTDNVESVGEQCDVLILDANFTAEQGVDFLMELLAVAYLPVLMLTPVENQRCAIEAMRAGAFNYLVKTTDYLELVPHAVTEALKRFNERDEMKRTIVALREQVAALEAGSFDVKLESPLPLSPEEQRKRTFTEVVSLVKRGEVNLPVYSPINTQFKALLKAQADFTDIANLLGQDVGVTTKLISVANSSYYRTGSEARTLEQALSRLGLVTTKNYVEVITNRALYITNNPKYETTLRELWEHGLACAHAAHAIAARLKVSDSDEVFTMAILHDVGKLFLVQVLSELESRDTTTDELSLQDLDEFLYAYHAQFGQALLRRWQLPEEFVRVAQHHEDVEQADPISKTLCIINCANVLAHEMGYGKTRDPETPFGELFSAKLLKLSEQDVSEVKTEVKGLMNGADVGLDA